MWLSLSKERLSLRRQQQHRTICGFGDGAAISHREGFQSNFSDSLCPCGNCRRVTTVE